MRSHSSLLLMGLLTCLIVLGVGINGSYGESPPVAAPLVREGAFALRLAEALGVGQPASEIEAESMLGAAGVAPRNGWIADYPVTPDIIGELRSSISYASQSGTLPMDNATALRALENVQIAEDTTVTPADGGGPTDQTLMSTGNYPDQNAVNSYYYDQGPPILTYYSPPVDYYYLYSWVPYPFWWGGFWFGGYFILNDFHRHVREHGHHRTVSNHFNDTTAHKVFRIDPVKRGTGRTYAGIGAPKSGKFIPTGSKGSGDVIFNPGRGSSPANPQTPAKTSPKGSSSGRGQRPAANSANNANPFHEQKVYHQAPYSGGRPSPPPAQSGGRGFSAPSAPAVRGDGMERGSGRDIRR